MSAGVESVMASLYSLACPTCRSEMEFRSDAIGRTRTVCPTCHPRSVASTYSHPDHARVPQTLVRAPKAQQLPAIEPGQLRCQVCAAGIPAGARFCTSCLGERATDAKRAPCRECQTPFLPSPAHPDLCRLCDTTAQPPRRAVKKVAKTRYVCGRCQKSFEVLTGRPPLACDDCLTPAELSKRQCQRRYHENKKKKAGAS